MLSISFFFFNSSTLSKKNVWLKHRRFFLAPWAHFFLCMRFLKYSLLKPCFGSAPFLASVFPSLDGVEFCDEGAGAEDAVFCSDLGRSCSWVRARPRLQQKEQRSKLDRYNKGELLKQSHVLIIPSRLFFRSLLLVGPRLPESSAWWIWQSNWYLPLSEQTSIERYNSCWRRGLITTDMEEKKINITDFQLDNFKGYPPCISHSIDKQQSVVQSTFS